MLRYIGLLWFGLADKYALQERDHMASKVVDYIESPYASKVQRDVGHSSDLADTLRFLKEEIRSWKADNDKIM